MLAAAQTPTLAQASKTYIALYVRPEWREAASMVLAALSLAIGEVAGGTPVPLSANQVDGLLMSLVEAGHEIESTLPVLADALQFFVSRDVLANNPLESAASGRTTRLSSQGHEQPAPAGYLHASAPVPIQRHMALRKAIDYFFPVVDSIAGMRNCRHMRPSTLMNTYLPKWEKLADWLGRHNVTQVHAVTRHHIKTFIDQLPAKPQTKNSYINAFRTLWSQFIDDGLVKADDDPTQIDKHRVRKADKDIRYPLTVDELARLLRHLDGMKDEFRKHSVRGLLLTEAFGGPRVFETVAANFADIDWETGIFHIAEGKGGHPRDTVLIQAALDDLAWLRDFRHSTADSPLFVNVPKGRGKQLADERITKNTAWRWLSQLGEEVGIDLYPHRLRHTAGTLAEQFGSPAYRRALGIIPNEPSRDAVSIALLGHGNAAVNAQYNTISLREVRTVMEMAYRFISNTSPQE